MFLRNCIEYSLLLEKIEFKNLHEDSNGNIKIYNFNDNDLTYDIKKLENVETMPIVGDISPKIYSNTFEIVDEDGKSNIYCCYIFNQIQKQDTRSVIASQIKFNLPTTFYSSTKVYGTNNLIEKIDISEFFI